MQFFDNARLDIARQNLNRGRYQAAFEIFFEYGETRCHT